MIITCTSFVTSCKMASRRDVLPDGFLAQRDRRVIGLKVMSLGCVDLFIILMRCAMWLSSYFMLVSVLLFIFTHAVSRDPVKIADRVRARSEVANRGF